jgi:pyruvate kinase
MLESMMRNPRPTRAEVTDIANAVYDGTSAIMLSGETAAGRYPVESLRVMKKIAEQTEKSINYERRFFNSPAPHCKDITNALSHATCTLAHDLKAAAIVAVTRSGTTARMISRFRPKTRIIAITPEIKTYMQMALSWGVTPLLSEYKSTPDEIFQCAQEHVMQAGLAKEGELIAVTGAIASATGIAAFFGGRNSTAKREGKSEGEWRGELRADLRHIQRSIDDLKTKAADNMERTDSSIRRLHKRMDDHLRHEHKMSLPQDAEQ